MLGSREAIVVDSEHEYVAFALGYDGNDKDKVHSRRPYPSRCDWLVSTRTSRKVQVKKVFGSCATSGSVGKPGTKARSRRPRLCRCCQLRFEKAQKAQATCAHEHSHFRRSRTKKPRRWQIQLVHDIRHRWNFERGQSRRAINDFPRCSRRPRNDESLGRSTDFANPVFELLLWTSADLLAQ